MLVSEAVSNHIEELLENIFCFYKEAGKIKETKNPCRKYM